MNKELEAVEQETVNKENLSSIITKIGPIREEKGISED